MQAGNNDLNFDFATLYGNLYSSDRYISPQFSLYLFWMIFHDARGGMFIFSFFFLSRHLGFFSFVQNLHSPFSIQSFIRNTFIYYNTHFHTLRANQFISAVIPSFSFFFPPPLMTSLNKLGLRGVRSYSGSSEESIQFLKPLTIIVGANGSGSETERGERKREKESLLQYDEAIVKEEVDF